MTRAIKAQSREDTDMKHVLEGDSWIGLVNGLVKGSTGLFGERGYTIVPRIPEIQDVRIEHDVPKGTLFL